MNPSTTTTSRPVRRSPRSSAWLAIGAAVLALVSTGSGTAHARIDPRIAAAPWHHLSAAPQGPLRDWSAADATSGSTCPLRRVATTFVRCDDLTGNSVPAPTWILER